MSLACNIANRIWLHCSRRDADLFNRSLRDPQAIQNQLLLDTLRSNQSTEFGRKHSFHSIRNVDDFRSSVPLSQYEDYAGCIKRMQQGEQNILTSEPVRWFIPTGGSTGGIKRIPHPPELLRSFQRAIAPWITDLNRQYPDMKKGQAYWAITPATHKDDFPDDTSYLGGKLARLVSITMAVPTSISQCSPENFWSNTLRHLLAKSELSFVSIWHPSFFITLLNQLIEHWDSLVSSLRANRIRELRTTDPRNISAIWPHLRVISCWGDGHAAAACRTLEERVSGIDVQPKGLISTEAFVSLPYRGKHPLAVRSHFFEFMDDHGRMHLARDLVRGSTYRVVVTTSGGLYRYQLHDEVIVDGFVEATPSLRFRGKLDSTSDLVGEKLTEAFVACCLHNVLARHDLRPEFSMLAPNESCSGYTLFIESDTVPDDLAEDLHRALTDNPQYAYAVNMNQLCHMDVHRIPAGGYALYSERLVLRGQKLGNIKVVALSKESHWGHWFTHRQDRKT